MWSAAPVASTSKSSCAATVSLRPETSPSPIVKSPLPAPGVSDTSASSTAEMPAKSAGSSEHTYSVSAVAILLRNASSTSSGVALPISVLPGDLVAGGVHGQGVPPGFVVGEVGGLDVVVGHQASTSLAGAIQVPAAARITAIAAASSASTVTPSAPATVITTAAVTPPSRLPMSFRILRMTGLPTSGGSARAAG